MPLNEASVKADEETKAYSKNNMERLRRGIEQLNAGKGQEHELIDD